jgi:hypothetical protein
VLLVAPLAVVLCLLSPIVLMLQLAVLVWRVLGKGEEPRNEGEREREQEGDLIFLQVRSRDAS